jgi:hypothetical protein
MPVQQTTLGCCTTLTQTLAMFPYIIVVVNPTKQIEEKSSLGGAANPYENNVFAVKHGL